MAEEKFREEQWPPPYVGALLGGVGAATVMALLATHTLSVRVAQQLLVGAGSLLAVVALFVPMRTRVTEEGVLVSFGVPGWFRFRIPAEEIGDADPVAYRPLAEFGGWGIRMGLDGTRAYTARGNRGVRIRTDRKTFLVGSERPEELAEALRGLVTR